MSIFDVLTMIGGLCLFLFGMNLMGQALETPGRRQAADAAGQDDRQQVMTGFLTGLGITAVIQSSSATTVMVVGFVNSGLHDAAAGHQRHHGRQRGHHGDGVAAESGRHQQRQRVGASC